MRRHTGPAQRGVRVEDSGDRPGPRTLRIRCATCAASLVEHRWRDRPDALVMYRTGLDDGRLVLAHRCVAVKE